MFQKRRPRRVTQTVDLESGPILTPIPIAGYETHYTFRFGYIAALAGCEQLTLSLFGLDASNNRYLLKEFPFLEQARFLRQMVYWECDAVALGTHYTALWPCARTLVAGDFDALNTSLQVRIF